MADLSERRWLGWRLGGWLFLVVLLLGLSLRQFDSFQVGTYEDDARYVTLARALARGEPYGLHLGPGEPMQTSYPFVFPLLLAPLTALWPDSLERLKCVPLAASLVNVSLLYWGWPLLCRSRSRWWGAVVAGLYAISPVTVAYASMVMSEPVFLLHTLIALLLAEHCRREGASAAAGWFVALGVSMALALFTRSIGVALCAAVMIRLAPVWWRAPRRVVGAITAGGIAVLAPVLLLTSVTPRNLVPEGYLITLTQPSIRGKDPSEDAPVTRVRRGLAAYAQREIRLSILPLGGGERERMIGQRLGVTNLPVATSVIVTVLVLLGIVAAARWGQGLLGSTVWFEGLYFAAIQLWYFRDSRLLYPLQPFVVYQLLWGVGAVVAAGAVGSRGTGRRIAMGAAACAGVTLFAACLLKLGLAGPASGSTPFARDFTVGTTWIREHSARDAVVMSQAETAIHLYADRPVVSYPSDVSSPVDLEVAVRRFGVDYLLVAPAVEWRADGARRYDAYTQNTLLPLLATAAAEGAVTVVYESPPDLVRVYRVEAPWRRADG